MADYKWEVGSNHELIIKDSSGATVATISGLKSTGEGIVSAAQGTDVSAYVKDFLSFSEAEIETTGEPGSETTRVKNAGKITLKQAALGDSEVTIVNEVEDSYKLDLEGADATTHVLTDQTEAAVNTAKAYWTSESNSGTRTAKYYKAGTTQSWTLDTANNKITYTAAVAPALAATITGLSVNATVPVLNGENPPVVLATELVGEETKKRITLKSAALPTSETNDLTVAINSDEYQLALDSEVTEFDKATPTLSVALTKGTPAQNENPATHGTATITRTQSAGWVKTAPAATTFTYKHAVAALELATVSGLNDDVKEGVTVNASTKTVTLAKAALGTTEITVANASTPDATYKDFKLELSGATSNKVGFETRDPMWKVNGTTAEYYSITDEGWTLDPETNKVTYTAWTPTKLATITNLNSGVTLDGTTKTVNSTEYGTKIGTNTGNNDAFIEGITVNGTTMTLEKAVLTTTAANKTTLANENGSNYVFALNTADNTLYTSPQPETISLGAFATATVDSATVGTVPINQALSEYWTLDSTNKREVTYAGNGSQTIATISGLNNDSTNVKLSGADANIKLGDTTGSAITITVKKDAALGGRDVTVTKTADANLKVADAHTFNFALTYTTYKEDGTTDKAGVTKPGETPINIRLSTAVDTTDPNNKKINVIGTMTEGYSLGTNNASIKYTTRNENKILATVSGLTSFEVKDTNILLDQTNNLIKLAGATVGENANAKATLVNGDKVGDFTPAYKLALLTASEAPGTALEKLALSNRQEVSANSTCTVDVYGELRKGWKLNDAQTELEFKAMVPVTLATIKGLGSGAKIDGDASTHTLTIDNTDNTVTIKKAALKDATDVEITYNTTEESKDYFKAYTLVAATDIDKPAKTVSAEVIDFAKLTDGKAEIKGTTSAGWKAESAEGNKKLVYTAAAPNTVVATISGLKPVEKAEGKDKPETTNIVYDANTSKTDITLKWAALTNSNVTLETDSRYDYKLALDTTANEEGKYRGSYNSDKGTYGFEDVNYWEATGTTARYYSKTAEGWTISKDAQPKTITYTGAANGKLLATITNLARVTLGKSTTAAKDNKYYNVIGAGTYDADPEKNKFVEGVKVASDVITLKRNVLGTDASKTMVLDTTTEGNALTLALGSDVTKNTDTTLAEKIWELGTTSTYKNSTKENWTLAEGSKSISYTAQVKGTTLATITGLSSSVTADDIAVVEGQNGAKGKITLKKHALAGKNVSLTVANPSTADYGLALFSEAGITNKDKRVDAPVLENKAWSFNSTKTTAYYKANVKTEGYEVKTGGSGIIYTSAGNNKTLVTVTGLKGGNLVVSDDKQYIGIKDANNDVSKGLAFGTGNDAKKITLKSDVLGTSNLKLTINNGTNYTMALDSNETTDPNPKIITAATEKNIWAVSGTTATYKTITSGYFTPESDTSITYTAQKDKENGTIATIKGLKSGLKVADDGSSVGTVTNGTYTAALTLEDGEGDNKKITLKKAALATTDVTLTRDGTAAVTGYTLALDSSDNTIAPSRITTAPMTFVKNTNATLTIADKVTAVDLKGTMSAGWTVADEGKKIDYTAQNSSYVFATITGLKANLTATNLNGSSAGLHLDKDKNAITLDKRVLGTDPTLHATVAIENKPGGAFKIGLVSATTDSVNGVNDKNNKQINVWTGSGSGDTVIYKTVKEAYYANGTDTNVGKTITFHNREDVSGGTIATIKGVKSGLEAVNDEIDGITLSTVVVDSTTTPVTTQNVFTIAGKVLDGKDATITNNSAGAYKFAIDKSSISTDGNKYWTYSGTTAQYVFDTTEGYRFGENNSVEYLADDTTTKYLTGNGTVKFYAKRDSSGTKDDNKPTVVTTITGLKSGLTVTNKKIAGIEVTEGATPKITLSKNVLDTTKVTLTNVTGNNVTGNGGAYTLAIDDDVPVTASNQFGWVINDGVATLKQGFTTKGYTLGTNEITYTAPVAASSSATAVATVKGLKSGLTVNSDTFQIDGIVLGEMENKTVTVDGNSKIIQVFAEANDGNLIQLSNKVLTTSTTASVTLKNAEGKTYKFALADDVTRPEYSKEWKYANSTLTLTEKLTKGYEINTDAKALTDSENPVDGTVTYYAADSLTTKIAGIKKPTINNDNTVASGITFERVSAGNNSAVNTKVTVAIPKKGTFKIAESLLDKKTITLSNGSKNASYAVALDTTTGAAYATPETAVWNKTNTQTTATYTQKTAAGYSQDGGQKITYSATPTTKTLITLKGLKKEIEAVDQVVSGKTVKCILGIEVAGSAVEKTDNPTTKEQYEANKYAGTTVITLSRKVLTNTVVTVAEKDYSLKLDADTAVADDKPYFTYNKTKGSATLNVGKSEGWEIKTKKESFTTGEGQSAQTIEAEVPVDIRKITYIAAKPVPIATINGLSTKLELDEDGALNGVELVKNQEGKAFTEETVQGSSEKINVGVFKLGGTALNKKDVTITIPNDKKDAYKFSFTIDTDVYAPENTDGKVWTADGKGTAKYQYTMSEGYALDDTSTTLKYSKEATTVLATITGLNKGVKTADGQGKITTAAEIDGIAVEAEPTAEVKDGSGNVTTAATLGKILLTDSSILGNKVKLGTKDNYVFTVDDNIKAHEANPKWYVSGTTARYKSYITEGYALDTGSKSVTKKTAETPNNDKLAQMTITGLKKGFTNATINDAISINDDLVTLDDSAFGTTNIVLTNGVREAASASNNNTAVNYAFKLDLSNVVQPITEDPVWTLSNGTATLKQKTTAGFTPNSEENPTTLTYSKEGTPVVATVKGLDSKLKLTVDGKIASANDVIENKSTVNRKTVTTYTLKEGANSAVSLDNDIITLNSDALTTKKVTLTLPKNPTTTYKLAIGEGVITEKGETTEWTVKGTTATYRTYNPTYYTLDEETKATINYTKETPGTTHATVTGLKKDVDKDLLNNTSTWYGDQNGGVLTLNKQLFADDIKTANVKITSKVKNKDTFILALDTESDNIKLTESTVSGTWGAADNSGKATMKGTISAGWTLAFGGKTATYSSTAKTNQTIATITGLKSKLSASALTSATEDNVVTLTEDMLNKKNVTITTTKGDDYTLKLGSGVVAPTLAVIGDDKLPKDKNNTPAEPLVWTNPKGTATLSGYVTSGGGYILAGGHVVAKTAKSITYIKETATKEVARKEDGKVVKEGGKTVTDPFYKAATNLATITGIEKGDVPTQSEDMITVSGNDVSGNKLTVNGGMFEVQVDQTFNSKTLLGSSGADVLQITGSEVSVTGGKGDDYIDFGNGTNTFVYSNGDGNDVIASFTSGTDKLQIKSGTVAVAKSGDDDILIKVGTGSITLEGVASTVGNKLTILNGKGTEVEYWVQGSTTNNNTNPLLADNNYSMNAAQLSDIVKPADMQLTSYDFDSGLGLTKEDKFAAAMTYSKEK